MRARAACRTLACGREEPNDVGDEDGGQTMKGASQT